MPAATPTAPSPELEHDAIAMVKDRLQHRYPDLAPERVGAAVDGAYRRFERSRVRTFVPVLVEHEARDQLAAGQQGQPAGQQAGQQTRRHGPQRSTGDQDGTPR